MSGVKHTPSELHAVFNGLYWDVAVGPHDYSQRVASCHANHVLRHSLEDAERHARLFASAPDLLEVLESIVLMQEENHGDGVKTHLALSHLCVAARATIARTRGEQDGGVE